jgi:hypothetical protein
LQGLIYLQIYKVPQCNINKGDDMNKEEKIKLARVLCNHNVQGKCELDGSICGDLNCFELEKYNQLEKLGYRKESVIATQIMEEIKKYLNTRKQAIDEAHFNASLGYDQDECYRCVGAFNEFLAFKSFFNKIQKKYIGE